MKIHNFPQYSPEYWAMKLGKITASNFKKAMSVRKGTSSLGARIGLLRELVDERLDGVRREGYTSEAMAYGSEMESMARKYYEDRFGVTVKQVGFISMDDNIGCSPDGLIGDPGGIEIKCPLKKTHIKYLKDNILPTQYAPQVYGSLWITDRQYWDFVSFCPEDDPDPDYDHVFCKRVFRDEQEISIIKTKITSFASDLKIICAILKG